MRASQYVSACLRVYTSCMYTYKCTSERPEHIHQDTGRAEESAAGAAEADHSHVHMFQGRC